MIVKNNRILIVDDTPTIHEDFRKILLGNVKAEPSLLELESSFFGNSASKVATPLFEMESAFQGEQALELVRNAVQRSEPFAVAFIDMRMPPGWDGLETIKRVWEIDPNLEVVICSAFSDHSWEEIIEALQSPDKLLILKKPFDPAEARQAACALVAKWNAHREADLKLEQLQHMVRVRTGQLETLNSSLEQTNQELIEASRRALEASQSKSDFLANVSHEIRTPMTAILGYSDLLHEERLSPSGMESVKTIRRNGEHLLGLINDILDFSKIEAGQLVPEFIPFSPFQLIDDVVELLKIRANHKGLYLRTEFVWPLPEIIYSDPTRLKQILLNLVGNAIKFTSTGGITIRVRHLGGQADHPGIEFAVSDTGIGISKESLGKLFQPFSQADTSTTRRFGGTGLGLTISKRLSEILGGQIFVQSEPNAGSSFFVQVPVGDLTKVHMLTLDDRGTCALPLPTQQVKATDLNGVRILLAEDGVDNQRLLSLLLRKANATVEIVENGQLAFEAATAAVAKGTPFHVILMDMQMPVLDGYRATQKLRDQFYLGPIVALTAHAMSEDRQKTIEAGCDDYLTKPIDKLTLLTTVRQFADSAIADESKYRDLQIGTTS